MKTQTLILTAAATLLSSPALAHGGEHMASSFAAMVSHLVQSPYHVAGVILAVLLAGGLALLKRTSKATEADRA
jgi:hypothetical protein